MADEKDRRCTGQEEIYHPHKSTELRASVVGKFQSVSQLEATDSCSLLHGVEQGTLLEIAVRLRPVVWRMRDR